MTPPRQPITLSDVPIDNLIAQLTRQLQEKEARRMKFLKSAVFRHMLTALTEHPTALSFDSEELSYSPREVKARMGWDFVSAEDMAKFVDVLASPDADSVDPMSRTVNPECSFENITFEHHGLRVFMLFGQGTFVRISNRVASAR